MKYLTHELVEAPEWPNGRQDKMFKCLFCNVLLYSNKGCENSTLNEFYLTTAETTYDKTNYNIHNGKFQFTCNEFIIKEIIE